MIGKGKSISHTMASMSYGWNQEKDAEVILKEFLHGDTPKGHHQGIQNAPGPKLPLY